MSALVMPMTRDCRSMFFGDGLRIVAL
jgi:hypothetical protein